ncbi:MAG: ABC transporter permease [Thermoplasmata archaeon]
MELTAFISLAQYKFKKILFNKRVFAALIVGIIVTAVMAYASTLDVVPAKDGSVLLDVLLISFFLPVLTMFYSTSVIREEIEDMSITQVITSPMKRITAYMSYYTALLFSLILLLFAILTSGFLAFFVPHGIDSQSLELLQNMYLLVFLGCVVYSSLFLLASVVLKRSIYFGLFYAFIWEGFIGSMPGRISEFSIKHYIRSIGADRMEFMEFANAADAVFSYQILTLILLLLLAAGILIFSYEEFPG